MKTVKAFEDALFVLKLLAAYVTLWLSDYAPVCLEARENALATVVQEHFGAGPRGTVEWLAALAALVVIVLALLSILQAGILLGVCLGEIGYWLIAP